MVSTTQIRGIIWLKFWMTLGLATMLWLAFDLRVALSAFIGGMIAFFGGRVYALIAYGKNNYVGPAVLIKRHFLAEFIKVGLTISAFAFIFIFFRQLAWFALFIGYIVATSAYWLGLLFRFGK